MRTQLDDLRDKLKDVRQNLAYLEWKGLKNGDWYNEIKNDEFRLVSIINNIR